LSVNPAEEEEEEEEDTIQVICDVHIASGSSVQA
jgi:hypothetical protein